MSILSSSFSLASSSYMLKSFSQGGGQVSKPGDQPANALSNVQSKALGALAREIPGMDASDLAALDPSDYTPEKVAERIGQAVSAGLENARAQGKSEEEVQALYESAVKGVKQGFREAKDVLSNLNMPTGGVADQVEATEKATFNALADLAPTQQEQSLGAVKTSAVAARYQRADDFELTLQTQEGDTVRVRFSQDLDAQAGYAKAEDASGNSGEVLDVSLGQKTGYSFSVEGDLSAEEIDAIQSLVRDVGGVANHFFGGDVQKAFEQVSDVSFDSTQLASMDLHMSRTEQYSAVQRYQETQQMDQPASSKSGRRLGHLMHDFGNSFQKPGLDFLKQVDQIANRILQGLVEQDTRFKDASGEQQAAYQGNLQRMMSAFENDTESTL